MAESWRVVMICSIAPIAETLVSAIRELGHDRSRPFSARAGTATARSCRRTSS